MRHARRLVAPKYTPNAGKFSLRDISKPEVDIAVTDEIAIVESAENEQKQLAYYKRQHSGALNVKGIEDAAPNHYIDGSGRTLDGMKMPTGKWLAPLSRNYPRRPDVWHAEIDGVAQPTKGDVVVVGGGVVGLTTATLFALRGFHVTVLEKRAEVPESEQLRLDRANSNENDGGNESHAVAPRVEYTLLTKRALDVLERAGVRLNRVRPRAAKVKGVLDHPGTLASPLTSGLIEEHQFCVNMLSVDLNHLRTEIRKTLRSAPTPHIHYCNEHEAVRVDTGKKNVVVQPLTRELDPKKEVGRWLQVEEAEKQPTGESERSDDDEFRRVDHRPPPQELLGYDILVACDGANSVCRETMMDPDVDVRVLGEEFGTAWFRCSGCPLDNEWIHRWGHKQVNQTMPLVAAFPTADGDSEFAVFIFAPLTDLKSLSSEQIREKYCPTMPGTFVRASNHTTPSPTVWSEWLCNSSEHPNAVMVGDSGHNCHPFLMQGLSVALEDSVALLNNLDAFGDSVYHRIRQYNYDRGQSGDSVRAITDRGMYYHRRKHWNPMIRIRNEYMHMMHRFVPKAFNKRFSLQDNHLYPRSIDEMLHGKGYSPYDFIDGKQHSTMHWMWFGKLFT